MRLLYRIKQSVLLAGDFFCYATALYASISLRFLALPAPVVLQRHAALFFGIFILWVIINYINGLYDLAKIGRKTTQRRFIQTAIISLIVSMAVFYLFPQHISPKTILILTVGFGYGASALWRLAFKRLFLGSKALLTNVVMIGYTKEAAELVDMLHEYPEKGYRIAAIIDPDNIADAKEIAGTVVYHGIQTIRPAITTHHASLVVIAPHLRQEEATLRELYELLFWRVHMTDLPSFYEMNTGRIPPSTFSEGWFLDHLKNRELPVYTKFRTLTDYVAGSLMAIVLAILLPVLAPLIAFSSPGPIFIKQKRMGQYGKIFTLYKLRSMFALSPDGSAELDGVQFAKKDDRRVTPIGRFLRQTRLDELPQCWNLLKRDVTLIGPRPERPEIVVELAKKMPYYPLRHTIKPGITGWAAIQQHYTDSLETSLQKLQYDLYYIKNRSLLLDISILLRTINVVTRMMGQ